jgi:hypothetical protein
MTVQRSPNLGSADSGLGLLEQLRTTDSYQVGVQVILDAVEARARG